MNSTTLTDQQLDEEIDVGDKFYIPFWIILQFSDATPPEPFIKVKVISKRWNNGVSPDGPVQVLCCDLECPKHIVATDIPISYLIKPKNLKQWADEIANWFRDFPERE